MPQFGATVLVVDDEPDIRAMLHCALGDSGFELIEADDVPDAQLQIDRRRPDVIVLDWMLPTLSGLSFLEQLRQSPRTRGLPVSRLSAKTEELDRVRALEAGADDVVSNDDGSVDVLTDPEAFPGVRDALAESKLEAEEAEITMRPQTNVALDADDAQKMVRLLETLEDLDDVQQVYSNADISEDILATLE